jgi:hypothetical protein
VTTTGVTVAMTIIATTDLTTVVTRNTTITKTATGKSGHLRHRPKGATPMVHSRRPTVSQLHCRRSPSDQKQAKDPIKRQGDWTRQHQKPATSAVV